MTAHGLNAKSGDNCQITAFGRRTDWLEMTKNLPNGARTRIVPMRSTTRLSVFRADGSNVSYTSTELPIHLPAGLDAASTHEPI